jgi:tetratricopeptide (TPR) repeat protein/tRNA A-37 threonylcarbamoyl transferase component Bud32
MNPERWKRIDALLSAALESSEEERPSFLARECAGDEELRSQVERLVSAHRATSSFFEGRPMGAATVTREPDASGTSASPNFEQQPERTQPWPPESGALGRGLALGRYIVLNKLGGGGMGVVYAAYDPELDRKVALKLLRAEAAEELNSQAARSRLLREAQAMARLSHPNVIAVHDVGTLDLQIFIAMEFVEGMTLRQWLKKKERAARDILEVFVQAGRGLAAAHAAGLVHRDFKPDNVLIGNDGRVKVLDFGLARAAEDAAGLAPTLPALEDGASSPRALETPLTRSGAILGTPAYMSPEQCLGKPTDARTDEFSFCVALYEALYGERPFQGESLATLAEQLISGKIKEAAKPSRVPARVRQVLRRGLRPSPDERYPSMEALLQELGKDPRTLRRRALAAAGVAIALAAVGIGYRQMSYQQSQICKGAELKLAGVWDEERRSAVAAAFLATAKPYAADAVRGVERALDAYSQGWVAMHTDACAATRLRGEQSEELLDLRMQCLSERRRELKSLAEIFARTDPNVVENAVQAALGLTALNGCANAAALKAPVKPPEDPPTRSRVEQHRNALAEIKALRDTGKYAHALEMAKPVATASRETGYKPLEAEALLMLGDLLERTRQRKEAEGILYDAAAAAERARHAEVKAKAWTLLASVVASRESRMEESLRLARQSGAVVELLDNPPDLNSELQQTLGAIALRQGKHEEALAHLQQALDIREKALGPEHPDVAKTLSALGNVLTESGRYHESLTYLQRAVQTSEAALGLEHPLVADALTNWGNLLKRQGKLDAALDAHRRALAIREKVFGPESPRVASALMNVGSVLRARGRPAEALELQQRALKIQSKALGFDNVELVPILTNLGNVSLDLGNFDAGLDYHRRALAIAEKDYGPEHPKLALVLNNLGSALHSKEDFSSALEHFRRALAIREKALGAEHPEVATTLLNVGLTLRDQNKRANFELARGYFRRALAIREKVSGPESPGAADALDELGKLIADREPPKALPYFQRALAIREKALPADSPVVGLTLAWIGRTYLDLKQPLAAKDRLERASMLLEAAPGDPDNLAWTHFLLARALWDGHFDNQRAVALAQQARAALLKAGKTKSKTFRDIESWLSARFKTQASLR